MVGCAAATLRIRESRISPWKNFFLSSFALGPWNVYHKCGHQVRAGKYVTNCNEVRERERKMPIENINGSADDCVVRVGSVTTSFEDPDFPSRE